MLKELLSLMMNSMFSLRIRSSVTIGEFPLIWKELDKSSFIDSEIASDRFSGVDLYLIRSWVSDVVS